MITSSPVLGLRPIPVLPRANVEDTESTQFDFQTVTEANPVKVGDAIIICCAGLGEVTPPVASGSAAPGPPFAVTAEQVTVTIGGLPAKVLFAGLTPEFASLYQVNAVVPQGVAQGEVEVAVSIAGQTSSVVTVAVE